MEASPRRIFANAHTYHINSISVNSDQETYLSADDLRINLWHLEITDQSFSILFQVFLISSFCFSFKFENRVGARVPDVPRQRIERPRNEYSFRPF